MANPNKEFPTQLEKLMAAGYDAIVQPAAFPDAAPRTATYTLNLTDDAANVAAEAGTLAVLLYQKSEWELAKQAGTNTDAELYAPLAHQVLLYELIHMSKAYGVIGGSIIYATNCPDIQILTITEATALQSALLTDFCIPLDADNNKDTWLIVNLSKAKLKKQIEDLINDGDLDEELKQWIIDNFDEPDINIIIQGIIQDKINTGGLTDGNGKQIIIPDQSPPPPSGTGEGAGGITNTTSGGNTYKKTCDVPQLIAHKDLTGIRSILVYANLLPVEIGPLALRGAVDSFGKLTFANYKPRNLVSATFIAVGAATKSLTATIPPAPSVTLNYTNAPALAHNGIVDTIASDHDTVIGFNKAFDSVEVSQSLTLEYFASPGSVKKIGSIASPLRCSPITFQGLVTPVPVLVQAIDVALGNKSGLDLYLQCLEYQTNTDNKEKDIPFTFVSSTYGTVSVQNMFDAHGLLDAESLAGVGFRNTNQSTMGFRSLAGLIPGNTYTARIKIGRYDGMGSNGTQQMFVQIFSMQFYTPGTIQPLYTSSTVNYTHQNNSIVDIPLVIPTTIDPCEVYVIRFDSTFPDVFFTEIGVF